MAANSFGHKYGRSRMVDNSGQLQNKSLPKCTVDDGAEERIVILRKEVQFWKVQLPVVMTDSGKSIDDRLVQSLNAHRPTVRLNGGMGILINAVHPSKQYGGIPSKCCGSLIDNNFVH